MTKSSLKSHVGLHGTAPGSHLSLGLKQVARSSGLLHHQGKLSMFKLPHRHPPPAHTDFGRTCTHTLTRPPSQCHSQPVAYITRTSTHKHKRTQTQAHTNASKHKYTQTHIHKHTLNPSPRTNLHSQVKSSMTSSVVTLVMLFTSVTIIIVWYLWRREKEGGGEKRREEEGGGKRRRRQINR